MIPCLIWSLWFSAISSSLTCHKTTLNFVDCQLHESSILNRHLTETSIKNLREASKPWFRKSSVIALKANPNFPYFKIIGFQKTYFYPSSSFALVNFKNIIPQNWFEPYKQINKLNHFIHNHSNEPSLSLEMKLNLIELLFWGFSFIFIPLGFGLDMIKCFFNIPIETIFDGIKKIFTVSQNKIFGKNIIKEYDFERINKIRLDEDKSKYIINGYIILQLNPDYDYLIDEFIDFEYGEQNFQIIQEFIDRYK